MWPNGLAHIPRENACRPRTPQTIAQQTIPTQIAKESPEEQTTVVLTPQVPAHVQENIEPSKQNRRP